LFRLQTPRTAATSRPEALANAAKFTAPPSRIAARAAKLNGADNDLISKALFLYRSDSQPVVAGGHGEPSDAKGQNLAESEAFFGCAEQKCRSPASIGLCIYGYPIRRQRPASAVASWVDLSFEPNTLRRH
jgi:hypothetical protein